MAFTAILDLPAQTSWWLACAGAMVAAAAAVRGVVATRGSTAVPAAWWAVAACASLALDCGLRAAGIVTQPAASACLRLSTAALATCPAMSILGAKRPQHGVWQFIVASLALVIVLPAVASALARPGSVPDVHLLGRLFLVVLSVVGWMNYVATRNGIAATLLLLGQGLVLRPFFPLVDSEIGFPPVAGSAAPGAAGWDAVAALLVASGAIAAWGAAARAARSRPPSAASVTARVDPAFLAIRDTFGAAWTLRIAERFDAIALARGWPCRLSFRGLSIGDGPAEGLWQADARRALASLFRRFVTPAWLERHGWLENGAGQVVREPFGG